MTDVPTFSVDELFNDEDARRAERYRLAWMSARRRAQTERGSHDMTASSFEIFVESMREQAVAAERISNGYKVRIEQLEQSAIEHATRHREIFDAHLRQIAELTDQRDEARGQARAMAATAERFHAAILRLEEERDEARAEVVRLGKQLEAQQIAADAGVSKAHREAGAW